MEPLRKFEQICGWQLWILRQLGVPVYEPNFKPSPRTAILFALISFYIFVTVFDLHHFRNNMFSFSFALVTSFYAIIGSFRVGNYVVYPERFSELLLEAKQTYQMLIPRSNPIEHRITRRYTKLLERCAMFYGASFVGICIGTGLLPVVIYFWTGKKTLPIGVELPFVDPNTTNGYLINYLYQVSCIVWTPPGLAAAQNMYFALVFNVCIQYDIILLGLEDLNKLILDNSEGKQDLEVQQKLFEILEYHQRMINFSRSIENCFSGQIFVEISSNALQIVVILFVINIEPWLPGYCMIFVASFQLSMLCVLGALIEMKNDQFQNMIYDVTWHGMRTADQKTVGVLLSKAQQSSLLTYGGLLPLNMKLFVMVYKKIYSVFMMLQNI